MRAGRVILALLIALSVALLPAASGSAVASAASAVTAVDHDCCPTPDTPCDKAMDGCASMAACALKTLNLMAAAPTAALFVSGAALQPWRISHSLDSERGPPPLRPPRI
jgi:hypothetical protein